MVQRTTINGKDVVFEQDSYGDWILVMNYEHYGGTDPEAEIGPENTFPQMPNGETTISDVQNLGGNGELSHVDNISQWGNWNVDAVRLEGYTSGHNRTLKYFTTDATVISAIVDGGSAGHADLASSITKYPSHNTYLPETPYSQTSANSSRIFGYEFPMYGDGSGNGENEHWAISGNGDRWEMDDFPSGPQNTTIHRVWVRKSDGVINPPAQPTGGEATYISDDQIDFSWNETSDWGGEVGHYDIQILRDGTTWEDPSGGPSNVTGGSASYTKSYGPNSDTAYGRQVGIDSSFQFRVRASNSSGDSAWAYSDTVYTSPVPPHNPSVSRPDANTVELSWTVQSDICDYNIIALKEDTGSGYGSWEAIDTLSGGESHIVSGAPGSKGSRVTVQYTVGQSYQNTATIQEDARYQFKIKNYGANVPSSDYVYADYGNNGNVYFADDFELLSDWSGRTDDYSVEPGGVVSNHQIRKDTANAHDQLTRPDWSLDDTTTIRAEGWFKVDTTAAEHAGVGFTDGTNGYSAYIQPDSGDLHIYDFTGGPNGASFNTNLAFTSYTFTDEAWYKLILTRAPNGDMQALLEDSSGTQVASTSVINDTAYNPTVPMIEGYHPDCILGGLSASDESGNSYSDNFNLNWDQTDLADADSGVASGADNNLGISGADQGSYYLRLDGGDNVYHQLGDLSGESDVIVKATVATGSMDSSGEFGLIEFYDGSSWQTLRSFSHEYNQQGWVEVTALVPSSYLSTNNFFRFRNTAPGGGDLFAVDRVVVSDVLHEYTEPAPPSNLSTNTTVEDEITFSKTINASFAMGNNERYKKTSDSTWTFVSQGGLEQDTVISGLLDGEKYDLDTYTWVQQFRNGTSDTFFDSAHASIQAITLLPSVNNLKIVSIDGDKYVLSWDTNQDNGNLRVYISTDGGSTYVDDSGQLTYTTEAYKTSSLSDTETHTIKVTSETEDTTSDSETTSATLGGSVKVSIDGVVQTLGS